MDDFAGIVLLTAIMAAILPWLAILFAPGTTPTPVSPFTLRSRPGGAAAPDTLIIEARGPVPLRAGCEHDVVLLAHDVTDPGGPRPVRCLDPSLATAKPACLFHSVRPCEGLRAEASVKSWLEIGRLPLAALQCARTGHRTLLVEALVVEKLPDKESKATPKVVAASRTAVLAKVPRLGYLEAGTEDLPEAATAGETGEAAPKGMPGGLDGSIA